MLTEEVVGFLAGLRAPVLAVYEADPTGFGLARVAAERGIVVRVVAPGSIPTRSARAGIRPASLSVLATGADLATSVPVLVATAVLAGADVARNSQNLGLQGSLPLRGEQRTVPVDDSALGVDQPGSASSTA